MSPWNESNRDSLKLPSRKNTALDVCVSVGLVDSLHQQADETFGDNDTRDRNPLCSNHSDGEQDFPRARVSEIRRQTRSLSLSPPTKCILL